MVNHRDWDSIEKKGCSGFIPRDESNHKHIFEQCIPPMEDRCIKCGKTRQQVRSEWK